jgi:hypothetical protein
MKKDVKSTKKTKREKKRKKKKKEISPHRALLLAAWPR